MARLGAARLLNTNLDGATLSGAWLWETQRTGWSIRGVACEYAYWDKKGEERSLYSLGKFERLFADKIKVRLFYKDGISPVEIATLPALIKHLEETHPGSGLRLVGIHEDSSGVVVELTIDDDNGNISPEQLNQYKTEIETTAQRAIEFERKFLSEEKQRLQLEGEVKQLTSFVDKLILRPSIYYQGDHMGDTFQNYGQTAGMGQNVHVHDNTFNQIVNHFEQSVDLSELAKQLGELRQALMEKQDASPQTAIVLEQIDKAQIACQEKNPSKLVMHLKAMGGWTLGFAKEIGKDLAVEAIKLSIGMS